MTRLSDLTDLQTGHLAWRLDHSTAIGFITAARIARGEFGDLDLVEVFRQAGCSEHRSKILAAKVRAFPPPGHPTTPEGKERLRAEAPAKRLAAKRAVSAAREAVFEWLKTDPGNEAARDASVLLTQADWQVTREARP